MQSLCWKNDKVRYDTRKASELALAKYKQNGGNSDRSYKCEHCGAWHLTSKMF
jgi:hypothetical protein